MAAHSTRYPYLFDSAAQGPLGTRSLLFRTTGEVLRLDAGGRLSGPGSGGDFLQRFDDWYKSLATDSATAGKIPFVGGWFLYLGYELAGQIETVLDLPDAKDGLPVALAARCDGALLIDHAAGLATLIAENPETLEQMHEEVGQATDLDDPRPVHLVSLQADPEDVFAAGVRQIKHYLEAGDVFQVNLSREWRGELAGKVRFEDVYRSLRRKNPAPFAGLMLEGDRALLSSSPERLAEIRGNLVQTRPIAGTYPRGGDPESDRALSESLLGHPKERAEHVMLIDLERNDLGRVCVPGSVEVNELMVVETYTHVHHMVSNVRGRLREPVTPADVIRAVFPGGTITGCPKVRCMEIIAELEKKGRGFYTGSMGYVGRDGSMDMNILIRSMLLNGQEVSFRTGAGIVSDSVPAREVRETVNKVRGILDALGVSDV